MPFCGNTIWQVDSSCANCGNTICHSAILWKHILSLCHFVETQVSQKKENLKTSRTQLDTWVRQPVFIEALGIEYIFSETHYEKPQSWVPTFLKKKRKNSSFPTFQILNEVPPWTLCAGLFETNSPLYYHAGACVSGRGSFIVHTYYRKKCFGHLRLMYMVVIPCTSMTKIHVGWWDFIAHRSMNGQPKFLVSICILRLIHEFCPSHAHGLQTSWFVRLYECIQSSCF